MIETPLICGIWKIFIIKVYLKIVISIFLITHPDQYVHITDYNNYNSQLLSNAEKY